MSASPTTLTMKYLRDQGYTCQIVEKWNSHVKVRQDFLGLIDIIALRGSETLGVQCTTTGSVQNRVAKFALPELAQNVAAMREAGWTLHCIGWKKYKKAIDRKYWRPTIIDVS